MVDFTILPNKSGIGLSSLSLSLPIKLSPILEFILVNFDIDFRQPQLQTCLHVGNRLVVYEGTKLLEEEP